jgi:tight adherence protein B
VLALACLLVFLAVYLFAWHVLRPRGVSLQEEWKLEHERGTFGQRLFYVVLCGFACALAAYGVTGQLHFAALGLFGGYFAANALIRRREKAREDALRAQYGRILTALASALQGGLGLYQALEDITPSLPEPGRNIFVEILSRARTGSTVLQAVRDVARVTGWRDLDSLAMAVRLYETTGCDLVRVFNYLSDAVRERESDRKYVSAVTAEIRTTASVLSVLPFVLIGAARVLAPEFASPLFTTTGGNLVVLFCAGMVFLGNKFIRGMVEKAVGA